MLKYIFISIVLTVVALVSSMLVLSCSGAPPSPPSPPSTPVQPPASPSSLPDLTLSTPSGWSAPLTSGNARMVLGDKAEAGDTKQYIGVGITNSGGKVADIVVALGSQGKSGHVWRIPELASGKETVLHVSVDDVLKQLSLTPGKYTFGINIDPQNVIEESDETNNKYTADLTISATASPSPAPAPAPPPKPEAPDLTYSIPNGWPAPIVLDSSKLFWKGTSRENDGQLWIGFGIKNNGSSVAVAPEFELSAAGKDKVYKYRYDKNITPQQVIGFRFPLDVITETLGISGGKYLITLSIDPENSMKESNEDNNSYSEEIEFPSPPKIAFSSDRDGNEEIYIMNGDGTEQTRITNNPASDGGPDWSPDRSKIAFVSDRDGNEEIYTMNADGTNPTRLTNNNVKDESPAWSPDGTKIAFVSWTDNMPNIYVMDADGRNVTQLTTKDEGNGFAPTWFPDGHRLVFISMADGQNIFFMNDDGSNKVKYTTMRSGYLPQHASISPDGKNMVLDVLIGKEMGILIWKNLRSSEQVAITNSGYDFSPHWSPDGSKIVFVSRHDDKLQIYTANADGTDIIKLTDIFANDVSPDWE